MSAQSLITEINKNIDNAIDWDYEGQHMIERVYSLSCHILKVVGLNPSTEKCFNSIEEMKEESTENLLTVLDCIRGWRDIGLLKTVYLLSRQIFDLVALEPSMVECGN